MLPEIKKQHLIVFVLMLSLFFGGGVTYGRYLEQKAMTPVSLGLAEEYPSGKIPAQGNQGDQREQGNQDDLSTGMKQAPAEVVVHVAGAVEAPGVYTLPAGSRIIDAVELARPQKDADLNSINLAKKINDQEMIVVPGPRVEGVSAPVQSSAPVQNSASAGTKVGGLININTADQAQLETLPGIGPAKAKAIIKYREENGYFSQVEDIQNVSGIGPATFEKLKDLITI